MDKGASSCGTDGKCQAGACEKYQQGTSCQGASCPTSGTTFTPGGTCDGAGTCVIPASSSCFPFACGTNACKATCATDSDCAMPASCIAGSCGLKPNGAVCSSGTECKSTICAQGVCCATACTGTCMSCALSASGRRDLLAGRGQRHRPGREMHRPGRRQLRDDRLLRRKRRLSALRRWHAVRRRLLSERRRDRHLAAHLRRRGHLQAGRRHNPARRSPVTPPPARRVSRSAPPPPTARPETSATPDACGLKRLGQLCAGGSECGSGNCVDGVCCSTASCGSCQVCNLTGTRLLPAGVGREHGSPRRLQRQHPPCGTDGTCDGNGACAFAPPGISCGSAMCSGSTDTPIGACDGAGNCAQPTQSCGAYMCGSGAACLTMCTANSDCIAGDTCQSGPAPTSNRSERRAPRVPSVSAPSAPTASAARAARAAAASRAPSRGRPGAAACRNGRRSGRRLHRPGGRELRHERPLRRQRQLRELSARDRLRVGDLPGLGADPQRRGDLRRRPSLHAGLDDRLHPLRLRERRLQHRLHPVDRLRGWLHLLAEPGRRRRNLHPVALIVCE